MGRVSLYKWHNDKINKVLRGEMLVLRKDIRNRERVQTKEDYQY
jgi:hypothetical protein